MYPPPHMTCGHVSRHTFTYKHTPMTHTSYKHTHMMHTIKRLRLAYPAYDGEYYTPTLRLAMWLALADTRGLRQGPVPWSEPHNLAAPRRRAPCLAAPRRRAPQPHHLLFLPPLPPPPLWHTVPSKLSLSPPLTRTCCIERDGWWPTN